MLFQAKVTTNLNKRINEPFIRDDNRVDTLPPDTVINVETIHYGQVIDKNNKWFRDKDGFYFWSGGTNMANVYDPNADPAKTLINFNELIQYIPDEWRYTQGEGVNIAVLDTGLSKHPDIDDTTIIGRYNVIKKNDDVTDNANSAHGTFISGIIAANKKDKETGITGIAPSTRLIIVKVCNTDQSVSPQYVLAGLKWLQDTCMEQLKNGIINISLAFPKIDKLSEQFVSLFDGFSKNNTVLLAAGGDDTELTNKILFYPSSEQNVFAVGALSKSSPILNNGSTAINGKVKFIIPNVTLHSASNRGNVIPYFSNNGCSFSTAIMSGIFSLCIAFSKKNNTNISYYDIVKKYAIKISQSSFSEDLEVFKP